MDRGDAWSSHNWSSPQGRRLEIEPGKPVIQHHCTRCARDFIEEPPTGQRFAVYVSIFRFQKLPDPITTQWLAELCPGAPLPYDIEVRSRLIENRSK